MRLVFVVLIMVFISTNIFAGSVIGSKHDLSSLDERAGTGVMGDMMFDNFQRACVYCHAPHTPAHTPTRGNAPLWNKLYPLTTYKVYDSPTLDSTSSQPASTSLACLSCHDGTLAVDRLINKPPQTKTDTDTHHMKIAKGGGNNQCSQCHRGGENSIPGIHDLGIAAFGSNLSDDHPVSISYPRERDDSQFHPVPDDDVFDNGVRLFSGRVECASCHNVHNPDRTPFLRAGVEGSALCLTCHAK